MDKLPFFYYDIVSRMTPGATALATLLLVRDKMPPSWQAFFVEGQQNWKPVVVPLILGGLCYAVGVLFEVFDSLPGIKKVVLESDAHAFRKEWSELLGHEYDLEKLPAQKANRLRFKLWDPLVLKAGREPGMDMVFAHCHRFQAESRMFLHLIYAALLFVGLSLWAKQPLWKWEAPAAVVVGCICFYFSHIRNRRRWLQTIVFCKLLGLLDGPINEVFVQTTRAIPADAQQK